jgi:DNA-binding NtrC family response regulator
MAAKLRVLIIDDEAAFGHVLRKSLPSVWDVSTETDSYRALDRLLEEDFDIVILDLMIPYKNGMVLFQELAAQKPELCAHVIFITGGLHIPAVREFMKSVPLHTVIEKPFTIEEIVEAVLKLVSKLGANGSEKT